MTRLWILLALFALYSGVDANSSQIVMCRVRAPSPPADTAATATVDCPKAPPSTPSSVSANAIGKNQQQPGLEYGLQKGSTPPSDSASIKSVVLGSAAAMPNDTQMIENALGAKAETVNDASGRIDGGNEARRELLSMLFKAVAAAGSTGIEVPQSSQPVAAVSVNLGNPPQSHNIVSQTDSMPPHLPQSGITAETPASDGDFNASPLPASLSPASASPAPPPPPATPKSKKTAAKPKATKVTTPKKKSGDSLSPGNQLDIGLNWANKA